VEQRLRRPFAEFRSTAETFDLEQESETGHHATEYFNELCSCCGRSTCGENVIHDQNLFARMNRIAMNLELVRPIFEVVFLTDNCPWQLAGFANRYESGTYPISNRRSENEASSLDADNPIDVGAFEPCGHGVN
jgi:hypothetical protein